MTTPETPIDDNPDWTPQQNRTLDLHSGFKIGEKAREDALRLVEESPSVDDNRIEQSEDKQIQAGPVDHRALTAESKKRPRKTRRGLGPRQLLQADGPPPGVEDARKTY